MLRVIYCASSTQWIKKITCKRNEIRITKDNDRNIRTAAHRRMSHHGFRWKDWFCCFPAEHGFFLHWLHIHDFAFVCLFFPFNFHINNFFSALFPVIFFLFRSGNFSWCGAVQLMLTCERFTHISNLIILFFVWFFCVRFFSFLFCRVTHGLSIHRAIHTHDFYYCKAFLWLSNRMLIWMSVLSSVFDARCAKWTRYSLRLFEMWVQECYVTIR